jgi:phosphatidate cytidylyltransferase
MGLVLGVLTPVGDLFVSLLKRTAGTKDTGNVIPGHGGVLDRIDTWIWSSLIAYYLIQIFAYL